MALWLSARFLSAVSNGVRAVAVLTGLLGATVRAAPPVPRIDVATPARPTDDVLLDTVQHKAFAYFWNESDPHTGLTKDRAVNLGDAPDTHTVASIAATGYALASLPVAVERQWIGREAAYDRALATLRFVHDRLPQNHGFYYHFVDWRTGERQWKCELSSIDSALLVLGALAAGQYWKGTEVARLAGAVYERMDFAWMQRGDGADPAVKTLSHGWKPEAGWLKARWGQYDEAAYLYVLAMGAAPSKDIGPDAWDQWKIEPGVNESLPVFRGPMPLFIAQMPPGYLDLRGLRDRQNRDWWANFGNAHKANHAYCVRNPNHSKTYSDTIWGITACDQPHGYGAQAPVDGRNTGTVAPAAMIASIFIAPDLARPSLRALWDRYRGRLWGRYGFSDAFNVDEDWYDRDVLGLDLGMMLLDIENARSGLIWKLMMSHPAIRRGMQAAGMHPAGQ